MELTEQQRARAQGCVIAAAAGDALGAPYEFQPPIPETDDVAMLGGGILGWDEGEWTDDTCMSIIVLEAAAALAVGADLMQTSAQNSIAQHWYSWSIGTPDIGLMTSKVMRGAADVASAAGRTVPVAEDFRRAAAQVHADSGMSAGNAALMRTHAVVLAYLTRSDDDLEQAVRSICTLTHLDEDVQEACVVWSFAIRHAVLTEQIDARVGLSRLGPERAQVWEQRLIEAESAPPSVFSRNGWVVQALQAAWSAITSAGPVPDNKFERRQYLSSVLERAVRGGYDTDTVACIAGALVGAALGRKAVPTEWRRALFGWPGYEVQDLVRLVDRVLDVAAASDAARVEATA
ncbi:ADP-ribosylglycohydrolase family protein [Devriesea agamarum]|uniref:ADP-ribosylglycohydrolase family protein n=1 Tax=Devriesea agamarum TaxID=472569 RepID=UPI00071DF490|nr:ADP-ribosylglycohydrolase family protein [Devriesea agamarum]